MYPLHTIYLNFKKCYAIIPVMRRFKQARLQKKIKLTEAAELLGVSQPTISSWESERKSPTIEMLLKVAELYGVTTDYLLGKDIEIGITPTTTIPTDILPILDSKPVWIPEMGWALVNAADNELLLSNNVRLKFSDVKTAILIPDRFSENDIPTQEPIPFNKIQMYESVWLEPISKDSELRCTLRGRYNIKNGFAENDCGNKFSFSTYGATWLAFDLTE